MNVIWSSIVWHESHAAPAPEPTDVMQVPFSASFAPDAPTGISGMIPFADTGSVRTIGLKFTFTSLSPKSCALR